MSRPQELSPRAIISSYIPAFMMSKSNITEPITGAMLCVNVMQYYSSVYRNILLHIVLLILFTLRYVSFYIEVNCYRPRAGARLTLVVENILTR